MGVERGVKSKNGEEKNVPQQCARLLYREVIMSSPASPREVWISIQRNLFICLYIRSRLEWHTWRMSHKRLQTDYSIIHYETTSHMLCICLHDKYGNVSCININKLKCTKVWYLEMWFEKCLYVCICRYYAVCVCLCEGVWAGGGMGRVREEEVR